VRATLNLGYRQDGIRTSKTVNGSTTSYLLDGDSILKETTGGVATDVFQGPGVDAVLKRGSRWFTPDGLGSTATLTDSAGAVQQRYAYQPFGSVSPNPSPGDPQPFQFAGRENDGTGLYYCRARSYVPDGGRFLTNALRGLGLDVWLWRAPWRSPPRRSQISTKTRRPGERGVAPSLSWPAGSRAGDRFGRPNTGWLLTQTASLPAP
jgi:RHS repeat-associated protein